jgi:hypothetical protein
MSFEIARGAPGAVSVAEITGERSRTTSPLPAATAETPAALEVRTSGPDDHLI